jgi:hypothetical protein
LIDMGQFSDDGGVRGNGSKPASPLQAAIADAVEAFSKDPGGTARRLRDAAERALGGAAGGAGGGRDALAGLAAAASRFLSDLQPAAAAGRGGEAAEAPAPGVGPAAPSAEVERQGGEVRAAPGRESSATLPFVELRRPGGEGGSVHLRAAAVEAVAPAGEAGCALHLADGSTMEAGECSDDAARSLPGLARLSRVGTQRGVYVRPEAVLAVVAPAEGGCVLRLRGGRELAATEAAAVALGLLAGDAR